MAEQKPAKQVQKAAAEPVKKASTQLYYYGYRRYRYVRYVRYYRYGRYYRYRYHHMDEQKPAK